MAEPESPATARFPAGDAPPGPAGTSDRSVYVAEHAAQVAAAARRIAPHTRRTPSLTTDVDPGLRLKPESLQVTGSFKARGAFNAILRLRELAPDTPGVVAVSSGNHAQALALAARTAGFKALILIPEDANPIKVEATRALGAEVLQEGITFHNREARLAEVIADRGLTLVHPFDDWDIIHGQATAARELLDDRPEVGVIAAPCGGGGLLSGTALAAAAHGHPVRVIGVEPEAADDAARSFRSGRIESLDRSPETLADGVRTTAIGRKPFEVIVERGLVADIVTVSEAQIAEATRFAWLRFRLVLEPTGALPVAAYLAGKLGTADGEGGAVGLLLSGGNVDPALIRRLI